MLEPRIIDSLLYLLYDLCCAVLQCVQLYLYLYMSTVCVFVCVFVHARELEIISASDRDMFVFVRAVQIIFGFKRPKFSSSFIILLFILDKFFSSFGSLSFLYASTRSVVFCIFSFKAFIS